LLGDEDNQTYNLEVDLNDVEVQFPEEKHNGLIQVNENLGVKMKFPTAEISDYIKNLKTMAEVENEMLMQCIECVYDEEDTYPWNKEPEKEKEQFLESLPVDVYNKMQEFFNTSPYIEHVVKYNNSEGKEKKVVFRSLDDFFILD